VLKAALTLKGVNGRKAPHPQQVYSICEEKRTQIIMVNKCINICCSCFDTTLRSIRFFVKFWRPLAEIGSQNLTFLKIKPISLYSFKISFLNCISRNLNTWLLERNFFDHLQKNFRVLSFGFNFVKPSEDFEGKCHTLPENLQVENLSLRVRT
jgi:hypothetical protein